MNLIACAQDCRHQSEGYCELNSVTSLSANTVANCGYYERLLPDGQAQATALHQDRLSSSSHKHLM